MLEVVAFVHLTATAAMVGLIWFVQVVHYPLFGAVGERSFVAYEDRHRFRTGLVVGPLMGAETGSAAVLAVFGSGAVRAAAVGGLVLLAAIHASTVLVQVPLHMALSEAHDPARIARLVRTNWVRTVLWTTRLVPAAIALRALPGGS